MVQLIRLDKAYSVPTSDSQIKADIQLLSSEVNKTLLTLIKNIFKPAKKESLYSCHHPSGRQFADALVNSLNNKVSKEVGYKDIQNDIELTANLSSVDFSLTVNSEQELLSLFRYIYRLQYLNIVNRIPCYIEASVTKDNLLSFYVLITVFVIREPLKLSPASTRLGFKELKARIQKKFKSKKDNDTTSLSLAMPEFTSASDYGSSKITACPTPMAHTSISAALKGTIEASDLSDVKALIESIDIVSPAEVLLHVNSMLKILQTLNRINSLGDIESFYLT